MILSLLRGIILILPLGLALFFSRLYILKKRSDRKHILIQIIVLAIYLITLLILQYHDLANQHLTNVPIIVSIWLLFYFIVEPLISYITLFVFNRDDSLGFIEYIIPALVWTFIFCVIAVIILMSWFIYNGAF